MTGRISNLYTTLTLYIECLKCYKILFVGFKYASVFPLKLIVWLREGFKKKKKVRNFPHFSGVGWFEKVIFRKKYGLKMHKITEIFI